MPHTQSSAQSASLKYKTDLSIWAGLILVILFFVATGFASYSNTRALNEDTDKVAHTHEVILALSDLMSLMKDAETGQRGFVMTGNDAYLAPYNDANTNLERRLKDLDALTKANPEQNILITDLRAPVRAKMQELAETISLRRTKGFEAALQVVASDRGKEAMDQFRDIATSMQRTEQQIRAVRKAEMQEAYRVAVASGMIAGILGIFLTIIVAMLMRRAAMARTRQDWLQVGEAGLSSALLGDQQLGQLGESVLKFLAQYFDAHAGAFFVKDGDGYKRVATYGVTDDVMTRKHFSRDDGLLGQAAKDGKAFFVNNVPTGYLRIGSALGEGDPRHLLIAPAVIDGEVNAVFELGLVHPLDETAVELLDIVREAIGVAVRSADYRTNLQNLLEETQRQSEELQAQSEELRVSNEELEEQGRALKESQSRLEQQQAELEQTNSQLEEQAQMLEGQKDDLEKVSDAVRAKSIELEQASQYKSDFLANMSHELRTPLNSSLILAKLLGDNPEGNLTEEQVKFARTIQNSGNDLLTLINDILDLSKIEAGHMEIRSEEVQIDRVVRSMQGVFEPMANLRGLKFKTEIGQDAPDLMDTDRMRLEQIVRNLLSNAIKFTEKGEVTLTVTAKDGYVAFAVADTGIGIPEDKRAAIFEAFRQADSTISRKFGGTGLGLSISKELARLLGGRIEMESELGKGSIFTVYIPENYNDVIPAESSAVVIREKVSQQAPVSKEESAVRRSSSLPDDRNQVAGHSRVILIVEDDLSFAKILYDLCHEMSFKCLIANTADEALEVARQYLPSAVLLDVGLPDHSGLSVLDRLKQSNVTRHIPVHVISANDYAETALSLGAIGYMVKPVKRKELIEALKNLETKFAQHMRRVLIVEDDPVQRESMAKLLGSHEVETVGAGTAAECLKLLKASTFDCMVLDLSLPDASGYSLLETLSKEDDYAFPPVIVYTGRDLSNDEEQRLRRYSRSIIIKGAKSPERLLDEVTLFLHQVVSGLPKEQQKMLEVARNRDTILEGRRVLVVEDDVANVFALSSILEPRGVKVEIARNGYEAIAALEKASKGKDTTIDLVLMDVMMPEMDGLMATREIRKNPEWKKLPILMLTAKAMPDDQSRCLSAGANDYMSKPLDVEKLLSLVRVWMPR
ncbi:MAG: signal transduction histidine kinase [Micavibrio sp.]|nr:signal transduction histidine kinase [Micavibrio sp.]